MRSTRTSDGCVDVEEARSCFVQSVIETLRKQTIRNGWREAATSKPAAPNTIFLLVVVFKRVFPASSSSHNFVWAHSVTTQRRSAIRDNVLTRCGDHITLRSGRKLCFCCQYYTCTPGCTGMLLESLQTHTRSLSVRPSSYYGVFIFPTLLMINVFSSLNL